MADDHNEQGSPDAIARHFLGSLSRAGHARAPYDHWLLEDALPPSVIDTIAALPVAVPGDTIFNGTREINNSSRLFFSPENQARYPVCRDVTSAFREPGVIATLETVTGAHLSGGRLRIEYCQDVTGFWLEPHLDISVKLFTLLIYLSGEQELRDAGTDIYDAGPEHRRVATVPYEKGHGLIFIPGSKTWHGFTKRPIAGVRKSIIVNFVSPDWRSVGELA
ncbi:MAG TPA: hypothetical protein VMU22_05870 [Rhizomicrobium sp.]|nr:hypothetical protein [Rhizomicrobium sp.]